MIKIFRNIQNIGIRPSTNFASARRIRLGNTMSILGITTGLILLFYAYLTKWPLTAFIIHSFIVIATLVPPVLNYYQKNVASRISFILIANMSTICLSIAVGPNFNLQYFLFALLGMPFSFFGNKLDKKKILLCVVSILFFIYLEWHFTIFEPLFQINSSNSNLICIANNFMILLMILFQFYFFVNESNAYITDITNKSNQLKERNTQLEHFAYITSHDLNEPLRTVNSFLDIIQEEYEDLTEEKLNSYFTFIRAALSRMSLMMDDYLKYLRIGKPGDFKTVDTNNLISDIKIDLEVLIKQNNVTINATNLPSINCVAFAIKQLVTNLIINAIQLKKHEVALIIEITAKETTNCWKFCVADNSIGTCSKLQEAIFEMFTKPRFSEKYESESIGLTFYKKIIKAHKGNMWVESSLSGGNQFYFTIKKNL